MLPRIPAVLTASAGVALIAVGGSASGAVRSLGAQAPLPVARSQESPGPLELAAGLRAQVAETGGPMYGVLPALLQLRREYPASELDALADSMVAIAVDYYPRGGAQANDVVGAVRRILMSAMQWEGPQGVPYAGASDHVVALAYRLEGGEGTIWSLTQIPDRAEALEHMRHFAIADYPTAPQAVAILAGQEFGGTEGLAILRDLYDHDLVTESTARQHLEAMAAARGWSRPDSLSGGPPAFDAGAAPSHPDDGLGPSRRPYFSMPS